MKKKNLLIVALIFVLVVLVGYFIMLIIFSNSIVGYMEYNSTLNKGDYLGFNLDKDKIHFGTMKDFGFASRLASINVTKPGYVYISSSGDFSNLLFRGKINEYVEVSETIPFYVLNNNQLDDGKYESTIHIYLLKQKLFFANLFIKGRLIPVLEDPFKYYQTFNPKVTLNITRPANSSENITDNITS